ncbi:serine acetyltransferase [Drancourtella sp. An210]|nr:serine acetyltransferase [Drancourtella sp. An210]OUP66871.1 serine acetyltransferase [Drancourtella sp. An177]
MGADMKKETIKKVAGRLTENYRTEELFMPKNGRQLPDRSKVIDILRELKNVVFPGYFGKDSTMELDASYYAGYRLNHLYDALRDQIEIALKYQRNEETDEEVKDRAEQVTDTFFDRLPNIQESLLKDVQAGFDGDPAAQSKEEIIFSYPGLFAIYVYRLAHVLYQEKIPFIPRIMSEYAHGRTGIDINPGATIGEYFFIDHGTGIVIGETTVIGNNVKLYQGVTLGALSTRNGQQLAGIKRHPTIEDNVTIYSNSSVLGGETVIGEHCIIGGNTFITRSVPPYTKVSAKSPELVFKTPKEKKAIWEWEN